MVQPDVATRRGWEATGQRRFEPTAKAVFERRLRVIDTQVVMDVNNALFKILATS